MKSKVMCIVLIPVFLMAGSIYGNDITELLEIGSFNMPDSPAFDILGVSPSSISKPGSAHELSISLLSSSYTSDSSFPKNIAIEFTPFWWRSHPELTYDMYNPTGSEIVGNNLIQTFTFSVATAKSKMKVNGVEVAGTSLGLGFRTSFMKGRPSKKGREAYTKFVTWLQDAALGMPDPDTLPKDDEGDPWDLPGLDEAQRKFRDANSRRVGLRLELGGAVAYNFPDDSDYDSEFKNAGAWLTSAYKSDEGSVLDHLEFLAVFRYLLHDPDKESFSSYDTGGRVVWIIPKEDFPLSLSGEYIYRFVSGGGKEDTRKLAFIVEYPVNDCYSIFASFGETFDQDFEGNENFISMFGINFGFGKGPVVTK